MAIAAKTRLPLLSCILVIVLFLGKLSFILEKLKTFGYTLCCYKLHALTI